MEPTTGAESGDGRAQGAGAGPESVRAAAQGVRRRAALLAFARRLGPHLAVGLFVAGGAGPPAPASAGGGPPPAFGGATPSQASWCLLLALLAPLTARRGAREDEWSEGEAATWLDLRVGGDGAVVTSLEAHDPRWSGRVERALDALPELGRPRLARIARAAAPGAVFAALALVVPLPARAEPGPPRELFTQREEELTEKLAALEETLELTESHESELERMLERLADEARQGSPESFFEAADALESQLERTVEQQAAARERAAGALGDAARSAEAQALEASKTQISSLAADTLAAELDAAMMQALEQLSRELGLSASDAPAGSAASGEAARELARKLAAELGSDRLAELAKRFAEQNGAGELGLDAAELAALAEGLEGALGEQLAELAKKGLLKPGRFDPSARARKVDLSRFEPGAGEPCSSASCKAAGKCSGSKDCDGEGHCHAAECMAAGECTGTGACQSAGASATLAGGKPGQGGITRGRGDAELTFGEESSEFAERFRPHALPPGRILDADSSTLLGVSSTTPTVAPVLESAAGGSSSAAGGEAAWKRRLSPAHRDAVRSFFSRE